MTERLTAEIEDALKQIKAMAGNFEGKKLPDWVVGAIEGYCNRIERCLRDAGATPCPGCDGHECDEGCQYPGATKAALPLDPTPEMRAAAAYYLGRSIDISELWRAMVSALPRIEKLESEVRVLKKYEMKDNRRR